MKAAKSPVQEPDVPEQASSSETIAPAKGSKTKVVYEVLDPASRKKVASYTSTSYRGAALKASKKYTDILLRQPGTSVIKRFTGSVKKLDKPKVVTIKGKDIIYTQLPHVKYIGLVEPEVV